MYPTNATQNSTGMDLMNGYTTWPLAIYLESDLNLCKLLADLAPDMPLGVRKAAAQRLGDYRNPKALQGLLEHLPDDPFWMVRYAMIQALERIADPKAISTLRKVAENDGFQAVRSCAAKAVERLS